MPIEGLKPSKIALFMAILGPFNDQRIVRRKVLGILHLSCPNPSFELLSTSFQVSLHPPIVSSGKEGRRALSCYQTVEHDIIFL